ncbi:unnamed protein product [Didymodactylos carnosus]|nr:unnamed protein product [Didymodactylos carnosus]CAF4331926.1 unnamed protein product [Didymodactylos carnosus]
MTMPGCKQDPSATVYGRNGYFTASAWTYNTAPQPCPFGKIRALLKFNQMSLSIPPNAHITSATLRLFGAGSGAFSWYLGAPYVVYYPSHFNSNELNITRITAQWNPLTVTWNSQPQ